VRPSRWRQPYTRHFNPRRPSGGGGGWWAVAVVFAAVGAAGGGGAVGVEGDGPAPPVDASHL
jgi:hypothetical protein